MNASWIFLGGLFVTAAASILVVSYLHGPLLKLLEDLCGTDDRAKFWLAFSNVTLILTPLLFALHHRPSANSTSNSVFELAGQLEIALMGLVASVIAMGFVLGRFIRRSQPIAQEKHAAMKSA
ncbi:MAG: hypothetical protein WBP79_07670 [Candidatus Acidiferrales bacterium]